MTTILIVLILSRIALDFFGWFQPKAIYDILYIILFLSGGTLLLVGYKQEVPSSPLGWIFIAIAAVWGLYMYLKAGKKRDTTESSRSK